MYVCIKTPSGHMAEISVGDGSDETYSPDPVRDLTQRAIECLYAAAQVDPYGQADDEPDSDDTDDESETPS